MPAAAEPGRPAAGAPLSRESCGPILVIAGPTASGKSALAIDCAEAFGGVVINADSMQVYRELSVLTARPSAADMARAPHRLFGVLPAAEPCSAGRWLDLATAAIGEARATGRLPIVVGGTGLYLEALMQGLAPIPAIPASVRDAARAEHARLGGEAFRQALARRDPESAAALPATDSQRLIRAWEVVQSTGRPLPDWRRLAPATTPLAARFATVLLLPPRERLYAEIDARFEAMLAGGAVDEVRALLALNLDPALPAMKAVGVREIAAALDGERSMAAAVEAAKRASRTYAKRQMTWLRHRGTADLRISAQYSESFCGEIFSFIRQFLLTEAM